MGDEMLSVENLHVSVDDTEIIKGLSLKINLGEVHAIMGEMVQESQLLLT